VAVLYTSSEVVPVRTGSTVVVFVNATLGINNPLSVDVISSAPVGFVVPIPTWAFVSIVGIRNKNATTETNFFIDVELILLEYKSNLYVLPSSLDLSAAEIELSAEPGREYILKEFLLKIKDKYDIVIIDEAHENYFAKTVQNILEKTSPTKQILLTGTPYQFVDKKEFKIHFLALNDLDSSLLPKLRFDIIESDYEWNGNYNNLGEIKSSFIFKKENTDKTLDDTFKFIFDRQNFKEVNKTLIVCKSINQSELVKSYLDNIGICSEISNSKNDTKSDVVNDFKQNKIKVLIVVNRARLGYDDADLVNLIDMSGTLNPNIIYQMFARLLRGDSSQQKYYIRLTSKNDETLNSEISTSLALMLTDKKYIQVFNGKNFKIKNIIIKKEVFINLKKNKDFKNKDKTISRNKILVETNDIINFYKNVIVEAEKNIGLYRFCKVSEVLNQLKIVTHTLESCKEIASKYKSKTEWRDNDSSSYQFAYKNGWLDECCINMIFKKRINTLESIKEIASKFKTKTNLFG
jgi:hypothetical protein